VEKSDRSYQETAKRTVIDAGTKTFSGFVILAIPAHSYQL